jgi:dihydropteroate synthase
MSQSAGPESHTPEPMTIGRRRFVWGERTFVMGIVNVTPDSFSGDGLLADVLSTSRDAADAANGADPPDPVDAAVAQARSMAAEGADLLDVGGESTRPGHVEVATDEEIRRIVPVIEAIHRVLPDMPVSVDTTKPAVAEAALAAGADLVNHIWGVAEDDGIARVAAAHGAPLVLMHNRAEPRYDDLVAEVIADLAAAIERSVRAGVARERLIVDPGFGFGKTPEHNVAILAGIGQLRVLGRPILLGTSRKSTLGRILDLPADQRLEATLATTAVGIAAGVDMIRVHDVLANVRVARTADAIIRGTWRPSAPAEGGIA